MENVCLKVGVATLLLVSATVVKGEEACTQRCNLKLSTSVELIKVSQESLLQSLYAHPFYAGSMDQFLPDQQDKIYDFLDQEGQLHFYL